ncbi:Proline 4-hydroxylase (includes Rps23 Pro-64 3,4-dihydroxylase Tpa1), contains SM-20 domain [Aquimarina amphilecti]|uniref:Proline 4-hydroxylase (Includes Rps23 Pro-64 3,4-dihydroxylase Tpa1), contains SM-20 domain n=1 Tax=Aquimarina amphilecti TaxID=1038014 RepID=A0A1H7WAR7_AQUAM|nr:2OG-Fe(II) oxygenase [Aquimarina amphilecti]SEM18672.1 Proline 4-hydroxylase (includes Rps23 Pro-64 3,4-dihydroxylase Tpa1), contains SM-20 domain [Aquimarina amphilecti]
MNHPNRDKIADLIFLKLKDNEEVLKKHFDQTSEGIGYFYLDDVLPNDLTRQVFDKFPRTKDIKVKRSIREYKYVAAQMNKYHPLLEEIIYAFQDKRIVDLIAEICGYSNVKPDDKLYAGGISMMGKGNYLNPHLDNSHDKDVKLWRVLNLLYYVTPDWIPENGGNLELWPEGLKNKPVSINSSYNRLVVMATHKDSWHSVGKVKVDNVRCCISNYYFSTESVDAKRSFHVTTFRGWPGQFFRDKILKIDSSIRMGVRKIFKKGIRENPHVYKKDD